MEQALGPAYAESWASDQHLGELGGLTPAQALADGVAPKQVWRAVWAALELPPAER